VTRCSAILGAKTPRLMTMWLWRVRMPVESEQFRRFEEVIVVGFREWREREAKEQAQRG